MTSAKFYARRAHGDSNLAVARNGIRRVGRLQDLGRAMSRDYDLTHGGEYRATRGSRGRFGR